MNDISQTRQMRLGFIAPTSLATQMTRHPTVDNTLGTTYNIMLQAIFKFIWSNKQPA